MPDIYIPAACLADARRVLAAQDPEISRLASKWPAAQWRAAVKAAAQEIEQCAG
ncbi:hypothetical protein N5K27_22640 [Pigmentiphaga sp. GD03639]|uniref:hypothetical protein n=1 Tax=Pigmentiphaga sp. GD03639 TaxID=2975354 RepID=UPI00244AB580|nr:hypothetical protein [Pigmentiphaga sp. GD03639]MDH2239111.1 hypothetical protein [Pigmentiphaga sp. GD03639]